jgi:hypothetical protein
VDINFGSTILGKQDQYLPFFMALALIKYVKGILIIIKSEQKILRKQLAFSNLSIPRIENKKF